MFALEHGSTGDLFVQKSPAATVQTIVEALSLILDANNLEINVSGVRPGEKYHETLLTSEEAFHALEHNKYFQVPKLKEVEKHYSPGSLSPVRDYTSENTKLLNAEELAAILQSIPQINEIISSTR